MYARLDAIQRLQADLAAIRAEAAGLAERPGRVERELTRVSGSAGKAGRQEIYDHSYAVAARLVREGADAAELVASCGLVRGEAELMMRLYGTGVSARDVSNAGSIGKPSAPRPARRARAAG